MLTRRKLLLTAGAGTAFGLSWPAMANFELPPHRHIARIEARLQIWREHAMTQRDVLLNSAEPHIAKWRALSAAIPNAPDKQLLEGVNSLINSEITYRSDYEVHQTSDFWATLDDALVYGGDCEDYALAKATTLGFHGWTEERMHLVVGILWRGGNKIPHAILVVEDKRGNFWALDNLLSSVRLAEEMPMRPIYGVDTKGTWLFTRAPSKT